MSKKPKMIMCRNCNTQIVKDAKICPSCGAKNKKPIYKRVWFILLVIVAAMATTHSIKKSDEEKFDWKEVELAEEIVDVANEIDEAKKEIEDAKKEIEDAIEETVFEPEDEILEEEVEAAKSEDTLSKEFKEAMDGYEAFMNEYCEFMEKYSKSDGTDLGLVADYAKYMTKYAEMIVDFEAWNDEEMSMAELEYYMEVQSRVSQKLLQVAG